MPWRHAWMCAIECNDMAVARYVGGGFYSQVDVSQCIKLRYLMRRLASSLLTGRKFMKCTNGSLRGYSSELEALILWLSLPDSGSDHFGVAQDVSKHFSA